MRKLQIVVGAQAGSEAKGAIAGYLAGVEDADLLAIRAGSPNAGHTIYDDRGRSFALRQIPVAAVTNHKATLAIGSGADVDVALVRTEVTMLEASGHFVTDRLVVDPMATVLEEAHVQIEKDAELTARLGSTSKGVGAARAARVMRTAQVVGDVYTPWRNADTAHMVESWDGAVQLEGTQGYALGLHHHYYPYTTSRDCRAVDLCAECGVNPWRFDTLDIWLVARVYPIRVAGNSGPLPRETSWADLGLPEELTTVTRKVRRVAEWDPGWVRDAVQANGTRCSCLALTMVDQMFPEAKGVQKWDDLPKEARDFVREVETDVGAEVLLVGTSPTTVVDRR